ncbi:MAG: FAD-binding oxidoreductase, partial [Chloroflexi bacterium]|nr:FAD-binding oxidoreductase [Chloroflexota bacterium]
MKATADVVMIGGGVIGTSILFNLGRLGVTDTLLLERDVLGSGSTGRSQAICRMHYSNPVTAQMAWESLSIFTNFNEAVGGESGFVETGYLVIVDQEESGGLARNVAMQHGLGIDTMRVTASDLREIAPMVAVTEGEAMAWEPQ